MQSNFPFCWFEDRPPGTYSKTDPRVLIRGNWFEACSKISRDEITRNSFSAKLRFVLSSVVAQNMIFSSYDFLVSFQWDIASENSLVLVKNAPKTCQRLVNLNIFNCRKLLGALAFYHFANGTTLHYNIFYSAMSICHYVIDKYSTGTLQTSNSPTQRLSAPSL